MLIFTINGSVVEILDFGGPFAYNINILWGT